MSNTYDRFVDAYTVYRSAVFEDGRRAVIEKADSRLMRVCESVHTALYRNRSRINRPDMWILDASHPSNFHNYVTSTTT